MYKICMKQAYDLQNIVICPQFMISKHAPMPPPATCLKPCALGKISKISHRKSPGGTPECLIIILFKSFNS